jgi:excisionase family DNA binding protein
MSTWFTQKEASEYLRCSESTIKRARQRGALPFQKLADHVKIRKEHLDALLTEQPPAAPAPAKSWTATRITRDSDELPEQLRRQPSRRAVAA